MRGGHEIAQNLTLSSKLIAANPKPFTQGPPNDGPRPQGFELFQNRPAVRNLHCCAVDDGGLSSNSASLRGVRRRSRRPPHRTRRRQCRRLLLFLLLFLLLLLLQSPRPPPFPPAPRPQSQPARLAEVEAQDGEQRPLSRHSRKPRLPLPFAPFRRAIRRSLARSTTTSTSWPTWKAHSSRPIPTTPRSTGRFYFARPGRLRFDYALPSRLKIISNGYYLAIEDYALNTSDKYPLEMTPFRLLLSETVDLAKDANILGIEQGPDAVVMTVEDKKGDAAGRISLFFNKADMSLKEWIITDAQGLNTRIEVSDLEQNKRVSAELFEFSKDVGFHRE